MSQTNDFLFNKISPRYEQRQISDLTGLNWKIVFLTFVVISELIDRLEMSMH